MQHTIKFWNANTWHVFDEFGPTGRDDCVRIARKLALLFPKVEIHTVLPSGELTIERTF